MENDKQQLNNPFNQLIDNTSGSIVDNNEEESGGEKQSTGYSNGNNSNNKANNIEKTESKIMSPQEEIEYLRAQIAEKQKAMENMPRQVSPEEYYVSAIKDHKEQPIERFTNEKKLFFDNIQDTLRDIGNKDSDKQIIALSEAMFNKGVRYVLEVIDKLNNPALEDDFHRFLIKYIFSNHNIKEKDFSRADWKALHLKLFQILPPKDDDSNAGGQQSNMSKKDPKQVIALMEQFYAVLQSVANDPNNSQDNYYTLELATANDSPEFTFYIAVPLETEDLLNKTLRGYFPGVEIRECKTDYNIFSAKAWTVSSFATGTENSILPLKTYKNIEGDPISVLINAFNKLNNKGEGAALQILVRPAGEKFRKRYGAILDYMRKGDKFKKAIERQSLLGGFYIGMKDAFFEKGEKSVDQKSYKEEEYMKGVTEKLSSTILDTNVRLIATSDSKERSTAIISDLKSVFKQYSDNAGNSLNWMDVKVNNQMQFIHNYIYRIWDNDHSMPLNIAELATLYHLPSYVKDFHQLKIAKMKTAEAPFDLKEEGISLGLNDFKGKIKNIYFPAEDRMRHLYVIGQTGTGKTSILKSMIVQDIHNGAGVCFIDPHGSDIEDILANIPPERYDDVVYFDPADLNRPMGLNMFEYDASHPEQKTFVVNELIGIFNKLFDMKTAGGPMFEQYFRNSSLLVMEHPESGNTLLDLSRVFSNEDYRNYKLSKCKNGLVTQFWNNALATTGDHGLKEMVPWMTSKFDGFLSNDYMRPIVSQEKSSIDVRQIMDSSKIFLVNLSKGRLGDLNSSLLGLILVGKFSMAALGRVDIPNPKDRRDFYLYLDEFQNITTPAIASILSEARKYRLSLNIAHQYIKQLPDDIKDAVFGNVGSMGVFRVGPEDAKFLETQFLPEFSADDIMKIDNYNCYMKLLSDNKPQPPFSLKSVQAPRGNPDQNKKLKELSALKYGRPIEEINAEIEEKFTDL